MQKLKVGLVGVCFPNFDALRLGVYRKSVEAMNVLASTLGFDLVAVPQEVQSLQDAERAADFLESEGADFLLIQASSFALGDVILPLASLTAWKGLWFLPEPSFEGDIPLNSLTGFNLFASIMRRHLKDNGQPFKWFYGMPENAQFRRRLEITVRALGALKKLRRARIGLIGDYAPTFFNLEYDAEAIANRLGVRIEVEMLSKVFERAGQYSEEAARKEAAAMRTCAADVQVTPDWLLRTARVALALRDLAREGRCDALAVRCWPEFQAEMGGIAPCAAIAWLNENGIPVSCEGDVPGAMSMLAAYHVSQMPVTMTDLVALAEEEGLAHFWHCGPTPASWADTRGQSLTYHPTLDRANPPDAPSSGVASDLVFAPGPVTIVRFSQDASSLMLASGEVVEGPSRGYAGSRGWVGHLSMNGETVSIPDLIETIAYYGLEHHYPLARGDWTDAFRELAAWTGIRVLNKIPYRNSMISPGSMLE
jgi:L-fucose isomerase-like protein